MEDVAALADRAVVLNAGRVAITDSPRRLFQQPGLMQRYGLDVPQINALMHRLRAGGIPVPTGVLTITEVFQALNALKRGSDD
jgi:energy-coupling factor transport system ATP-binding protein